jgi:hypothetical protein
MASNQMPGTVARLRCRRRAREPPQPGMVGDERRTVSQPERRVPGQSLSIVLPDLIYPPIYPPTHTDCCGACEECRPRRQDTREGAGPERRDRCEQSDRVNERSAREVGEGAVLNWRRIEVAVENRHRPKLTDHHHRENAAATPSRQPSPKGLLDRAVKT